MAGLNRPRHEILDMTEATLNALVVKASAARVGLVAQMVGEQLHIGPPDLV
jgi:hypothetical protein